MYACIYSMKPSADALLECASAFAPTAEAVELCDQSTVVFRVGNLGLIYGSLNAIGHEIAFRASSAGLKAQVVIANSVDAARLLGRCLYGQEKVEVVAPQQTATRLGALSVKELKLNNEIEEVLGLWGIRTLGDFAALPEKDLAQRFGREAVVWHRLARGSFTRPLLTIEPNSLLCEELDLEYEIELLEPLMFGIGRLLNSLCEKLVESGLATDDVTLTLKLAGGGDEQFARFSFRLPLPLDTLRPLLRVIRFELEKNPPSRPVCALAIEMHAVAPRRLQLGLFIPASPEPARLELTLARLRSLVGEENVGVPELIDSHHPQPFRLSATNEISAGIDADLFPKEVESHEMTLAMRYLRPPLEAFIEMSEGRPFVLRTQVWERRVLSTAGPWRLSGDWWDKASWQREEWDVALSDGAVYRIYREMAGWMVEGVYD